MKKSNDIVQLIEKYKKKKKKKPMTKKMKKYNFIVKLI